MIALEASSCSCTPLFLSDLLQFVVQKPNKRTAPTVRKKHLFRTAQCTTLAHSPRTIVRKINHCPKSAAPCHELVGEGEHPNLRLRDDEETVHFYMFFFAARFVRVLASLALAYAAGTGQRRGTARNMKAYTRARARVSDSRAPQRNPRRRVGLPLELDGLFFGRMVLFFEF